MVHIDCSKALQKAVGTFGWNGVTTTL